MLRLYIRVNRWEVPGLRYSNLCVRHFNAMKYELGFQLRIKSPLLSTGYTLVFTGVSVSLSSSLAPTTSMSGSSILQLRGFSSGT